MNYQTQLARHQAKEKAFGTFINFAPKLDVFVQWCGAWVIVWADRTMRQQMTARKAGQFTVAWLTEWCAARGYTCSQVREGRVWL